MPTNSLSKESMLFITVFVVLLLTGYWAHVSDKREAERQALESEAKKIQQAKDDEDDLKAFRETIRSEVMYQMGFIELQRLLAGTKFEVLLNEAREKGDECRNETDPEKYKLLLEEFKRLQSDMAIAIRLDEEAKAAESKKEE